MFNLLPHNIPISEEQLRAQLANGGKPWHKKGVNVWYFTDAEASDWNSTKASNAVAMLDAARDALEQSCKRRMEEVCGNAYNAALVSSLALAGNPRARESLGWINYVLWGKKSDPAEGSYYWRKNQLLNGLPYSVDFRNLGEPPYTFSQIMEIAL